MKDIHLLGIRHHGPGSCRNIVEELERIRPDLILLEGPMEAEALMPFIADGQMEPPVALLGYQPDAPHDTGGTEGTFRTHRRHLRGMACPGTGEYAEGEGRQRTAERAPEGKGGMHMDPVDV